MLLFVVISSVRCINTIFAGREINTIFLSSIKDVLQDGYMNGVCSTADVELLKTSLAVGHQRVAGLKIYALFAVSDVSCWRTIVCTLGRMVPHILCKW